MEKLLDMVENRQTSEFYPTPEELVKRMLRDIDFSFISSILEPSAGKGDILRMIARNENHKSPYSTRNFDVDCIELDPNLRQILKYNFSDERKRGLQHRVREIEENRIYDRHIGKYLELSEEDKAELYFLNDEINTFFDKGIHIVHDNFLTYTPFKTYDLIIMNPPFSNGDKHLLKAIKIQEDGGSIVSLLNAETIKNPCTESRKELLKQLEKYNAEIEFISGAFDSAERRANVEVALIRINIEHKKGTSDIYEHFKKAERCEDTYSDVTDLEVTDYIKAAVNQFNVEAKSGIELIKQYRALVPYMQNSLTDDTYSRPILRLTDSTDRGYDSVSINQYLKHVRLKYWNALLSNPKFIGKLTSKLQTEYNKRVEELADYDFSEFNIYALSAEMNAKIKTGVEEEIIAMFDTLTAEHSWYPETQSNKHYYDGWKTNKAHKIDKKVIVPCYGVYDNYDGRPRVYNARCILEDIERILNFLDGGMTENVDSWDNLESCFKNGITKNIEMKYFKATFYKKGTIHLVFNCPKLIERFNIYAAQHKAWLPPCYGKKEYKDMNVEEKTVIDSFQGEKSYNEILKDAHFYLSPVTNNGLLLLNE